MMDAQTAQALDHLIKGTASAAEIELLRHKLSAGQISIGGDVNQSVIILGDGNTVNQYQLTPEMVDALTRRKLAASVPLRNPIVEGINLLPYDYDQKIQNFLKEYLGDEQHPVPFGGRDDALRMLDDWLATPTPYLLLAAPAGRGKSALLVRWLDSLSSREDPSTSSGQRLALAFMPVSIRFGTNMERVFYAALAARLAFLHGDDVPASPETSTAVYRGLVSDYLSKPLADGRALLVVLDGLDEAADWQAGADFMPAELPAGVRVLVSVRFLAGDADSTSWLRRLNWERSGLASAPSLAPLDRAGVADVLLKMGCPLDELSRNVDIVAELYRLSAGDPLLVSLYVGDLWAKGEEVTRLEPEDLAGIQPGYKGYFDRWWDDQKKLWGKKKPWLQRYISTVQNLLAGALGPLFISDIQALSPKLTSRHISDALDVLQRFIIGDNQTQGYTFSHPKLGQYFWDALTPTEQAQVEGSFLAWGEQTLQEFIDGKRNPKKKAEVPAYIVRNYGAHLARARQPIEKWLPLIHHQQWAQTWFTVEGAYGGYLQDVQRVWAQCQILDRQAIQTTKNALYLGGQIRCALIESSIHTMAENIEPDLLEKLVEYNIWALPQALAYVRQMSLNGTSNVRAKSMLRIIPYIPDDLFGEILIDVHQIKNKDERADLLVALALRFPEHLNNLLTTFYETEKDLRHRISLLRRLAPQFPVLWEDILDNLINIKNKGDAINELTELVDIIPNSMLSNLFDTAKKVKKSEETLFIKKILSRDSSLWNKILISNSKRIKKKIYASADIIDLVPFAPTSELSEIVTFARKFKKRETKAVLLSRLAQRIPEMWTEAFSATKLLDGYEQIVALDRLVQLTPNSMLNNVLAIVRNVKKPASRAILLSKLAQQMPSIWNEILVLFDLGLNEIDKITILNDLSHFTPDSVLDQVLTITWQIKSREERESILYKLLQFRPDHWNKLLPKLETIYDEDLKFEILIDIAKLAPATVLYDAVNVCRRIQPLEMQAKIISVFANRTPVFWNETLSVLGKVKKEDEFKKIFGDIVNIFPEAMFKKGLKLIQRIYGTNEYIDFVSIMLSRMSKSPTRMLPITPIDSKDKLQKLLLANLTRCLFERLSVTQRIGDCETRTSLLCKLVPLLPTAMFSDILILAKEAKSDEAAQVLVYLLQHSLGDMPNKILDTTDEIENESSRVKVLNELVKQKPQSQFNELLEKTQKIDDEEIRSHILVTMVQNLPEPMLSGILTVVRVMANYQQQAIVLLELALRIPSLWAEVLGVTKKIQSQAGKSMVLGILAQTLPDKMLRNILTIAKSLDDSRQVHPLIELAKRRPDTWDGLFALALNTDKDNKMFIYNNLVADLPKNLVDKFLILVRSNIENVYDRASIFVNLAHRYPHVQMEALEIVKTVNESWKRAYLIGLLEKINSEPSKKYVTTTAPKHVNSNQHSLTKILNMIDVLSEINDLEQPISVHESFNFMDADEQNDLENLILENEQDIIPSFGNITGDEIASELLTLLKDVPHNSLDTVSRAVSKIEDRQLAFRIYSVLAQRKLEYDPCSSYNILEENILCLTVSKREYFLSNIMVFMNPIISISTDNVASEIYQSVRDVTAWWP